MREKWFRSSSRDEICRFIEEILDSRSCWFDETFSASLLVSWIWSENIEEKRKFIFSSVEIEDKTFDIRADLRGCLFVSGFSLEVLEDWELDIID